MVAPYVGEWTDDGFKLRYGVYFQHSVFHITGWIHIAKRSSFTLKLSIAPSETPQHLPSWLNPRLSSEVSADALFDMDEDPV